MYTSRNIKFSRTLDFLIIWWNMGVSCEFIIWRRKHSFTLKPLGYYQDFKTYIWENFQLKIISFTREQRAWILGFRKSPNPWNPWKFMKYEIPRFPLVKYAEPLDDLWNYQKFWIKCTEVSETWRNCQQFRICCTKLFERLQKYQWFRISYMKPLTVSNNVCWTFWCFTKLSIDS